MLSWYSKGLQKYKNLRNKYYKKYSKTHNPADGERVRQHKRELQFLNKFLYFLGQSIGIDETNTFQLKFFI